MFEVGFVTKYIMVIVILSYYANSTVVELDTGLKLRSANCDQPNTEHFVIRDTDDIRSVQAKKVFILKHKPVKLHCKITSMLWVPEFYQSTSIKQLQFLKKCSNPTGVS
jgi:hypothetical protein